MCVSVIISSYNHERFVRQSVDSVLTQICDDVELIVVDDGSSDGSVSLLSSLVRENGFYFYSQENKGICKTLNTAIKEYSRSW